MTIYVKIRTRRGQRKLTSIRVPLSKENVEAINEICSQTGYSFQRQVRALVRQQLHLV